MPHRRGTMTTLVFRGPSEGGLQQVQVGAADVVATLNAAQTAWGWVGGLSGIQRLLSGLRNTINKDPFKSLRMRSDLTLPPSCFHILTSSGVLFFEDHTSSTAFGGDPIMQSIGLTICALEHECGGEVAVDLFTKYVAEHYVQGTDKVPGLVETLYQQLMDHLPEIINEGTTRGLHERFEKAADALPKAAKRWQFNPKLANPFSGRLQNYEMSFVGGLLEWITTSSGSQSDPYFTRSSLAVRVAAYLKLAGHSIGPIVTWDGQTAPPDPRPRGVVLVLGGVSETDFCQETNVRVPHTVAQGSANMKLYFRYDTIGSMLLNSLGIPTSIRAESVQTMFLRVHKSIEQSIICEWEAPPTTQRCLRASFSRKNACKSSNPLSIRLASMYFTLSARTLASCYDHIATESILECVEQMKFRHLQELKPEKAEELAWFRIVTASIIVCIAGLLSEGFRTSSHVTQMHLGSSIWLDPITDRIDKQITSGLSFYDAAIIVGTVHSAVKVRTLDVEQNERAYILGFRYRLFAVVPSLLVNMTPTRACVGISCLDKFIANIPVFPDGSVRGTENLGPNWAPKQDHPPDYSWQHIQEPVDEPADQSLYLGVERPILSPEPTLVLGARIGGTLIGYSSVQTAMWVVGRSLNLQMKCMGHTESRLAIKLPASDWTILGQDRAERLDGPLTKTHCLFLPALGSETWALYVAGNYYNAIISYGCFNCATLGEPVDGFVPPIVVGYQSQSPHASKHLAEENKSHRNGYKKLPESSALINIQH